MNDFQLSLPLAQSGLDRDYRFRDNPNWDSEIADTAEILIMHEGHVQLGVAGELKLFSTDQLDSFEPLAYLGKDQETGLAIILAESPSVEGEWHNLRKSGLGLSPRDAAIFTQGLALYNWHKTHEFCPRCGTRTVVERAGWSRRCPADNSELFPRTDPAIIVGVIDSEDRILLGSQGVWEENRYSILAGFVEPGESLEAAVAREMQEEAGILVANPIYLGSQAWPFPFSLMLGYTAQYVGGTVVPDGEEIVKLRWFTKSELKAEAKTLLLPGKLSIARAIIEHWLGEELLTGE
ncbi:MAG: hypothetical protein RIS31_975 [Actinomycetota bacterium]